MDELCFTYSTGYTVSVISDATNAVVASIAVGAYTVGVAYDSGKGEVFVAKQIIANQGSNTVTVISDATNAIVANIPVSSPPYGVAYDSAKAEAFLTTSHSNTVTVISDSTNAIVTHIP